MIFLVTVEIYYIQRLNYQIIINVILIIQFTVMFYNESKKINK